MSDSPLISVVVPVYNTEKYLRKCLISLSNQTYHNIEIIVVDDGSKDGSANICDEFAAKDNRFVVIHKENGGISSARNKAISVAKGDYFMFVDSDDWVEPDLCESAYAIIKDHNVKLGVFGHDRIYERINGEPFVKTVKKIKPQMMTSSEAMNNIIGINTIYNYLTNKICKRELFEGIKFPLGRTYEDMCVCYKIIHNAGELFISDKVLYHYLKRSTSITYRWYNPESIYHRFMTWKERLEFLKVHYPEHVNFQIQHLAYEALFALAYCKGDKFKDFRIEAKKFLKTNKDSVLKGNHSMSLKLFYTCSFITPFCFRLKHLLKL